MANLLVSVRSAEEALAALAGGAAVIDVKEPLRGPLGRADVAVWGAVRAVVPVTVPVSVALGELSAFPGGLGPDAFAGIAYRKLGLAGAGPLWAEDWGRLRSESKTGPAWVAVIYADWGRARAPRPEAVLDVALDLPECAGLLIDSWDKARPSPIDESWRLAIERVQASGRFVALAGGLDAAAIRRLSRLGPDLFAVRGAACVGGVRTAGIDPARVAELVRLIGARDARR